jgi:hypothetical protein
MSNGFNPETPATPARRGCAGKACLTFVVLVVLFAVAVIGGAVWALRSFRDTYSSPTPLALPTGSATESTSATSTPPPDEATPTVEPTPAPTAAPVASTAIADTRPPLTRWEAFERAGKRGEKARIALTAAEINALLASDPELRGRGFVTIVNNVGRLQFSVPLDRVFMLDGRYLNGEAQIAASPDGDPSKVQISNIVIAGQPVPETVLDQTWFGGGSVRSLLTDWLTSHNVSRFEVRDDVVIGETGGR